MNDLLVIMGASVPERRGTMSAYIAQLEAAGIDYHDERIVDPDCTIGWKLRLVRKMAQQFIHYGFLVLTDAFDVQFFGTKEEVVRKIPLHGVLHGAEKNCHPPEVWGLSYPDAGPWKYANGGLWCGTPESLLAWCDALEHHSFYDPAKVDQRLYNELVAEGSDLARIDPRTELFFCLYGGYDELEFENGHPVNRLYGTSPNFIHANGQWSTAELDRKRAL